MLTSKDAIDFPYPVLCSYTDDIKGCFQMNLKSEISQNNDKITIVVNIDLKNKYLQALLNKDKATFWLEISCSSTHYHLEKKVNGNSFTQEVFSKNVEGNLDIFISMVAETEIDDYCDRSFNSDYQNHSFTLTKGDYIAVADPQKLLIDEVGSNGEKSIFGTLIEKDLSDDEIEFKPDSQKIWIATNQKNMTTLRQLLNSTGPMQDVIRTLFLFPALESAFQSIRIHSSKEDLDSINSSKWYKTLQNQLMKDNLDITDIPSADVPKIIRKIIKIPISNLLQSTKYIVSNNAEENDYE